MPVTLPRPRHVVRAGDRAARALASTLATIGTARTAADRSARACAERLRAAAAEITQIHGLAIAVQGAPLDRPAVYVANHVSYLDPLVIAGLVPVAPVAKGEVARWPVIGTAASALGVNFVRRGDAMSGAAVLRRGLTALRAGVSVLNFPEGTTTDGSKLLPFKRGIFGLAALARVPVVPVAIRYASADLAWTGGATFLPHYLRTAARRAPGVHVEIGAPLAPQRFESPAALAWFAQQKIAWMLRDPEEPHGTVLRFRVPPARSHAILPPSDRVVAAGS